MLHCVLCEGILDNIMLIGRACKFRQRAQIASYQNCLRFVTVLPPSDVVFSRYRGANYGIALTSAILAVGAIPVFADIDEETALLDPTAVPALITDKTKAILVVHLFGHVAAMSELRALADQHSLLLFEDASQAHGARIAGRMVGDCDGAAFSCMGLKLLAGTEGGYAVFRDPQALEVAYLYGRHPRGLPPEMNDRLSAGRITGIRCSLAGDRRVSVHF